MKHIFDSRFKYTPSFGTNIKKTFKRLRKERQQEADAKASKVTTLPRRRAP